MEQTELFSLSSGMRCVLLHTASRVGYCTLTTLAGSRFANPALPGLAHLAEHMLFKGTITRSPWHISNRLERLGGDINAFTTKEELVLQTTTLREDVPKALELMADMVFHSVASAKELVKEKEVVADEISSYKDSPSDLIYDEFEEELFSGTTLSSPILGDLHSLNKIKSEDLLAFYASRFTAGNMVLCIVGSFTLAQAVRMGERYFGASCFASVGREFKPLEIDKSAELQVRTPFSVTKHRHTHQVHCIVGGVAHSLYREGRREMSLLMNYLGGPASNAVLNLQLREKLGLVYTVEASYSPFVDSGYTAIYFGTDKEKLDLCLEEVYKVLKDVVNNKLSGLKLDRAKKQFLAQMVISEDNLENQAVSLGKGVLFSGRVVSDEEIIKKVAQITPESVLEAAQFLREDLLSRMVYC